VRQFFCCYESPLGEAKKSGLSLSMEKPHTQHRVWGNFNFGVISSLLVAGWWVSLAERRSSVCRPEI
jgi:hypothetical protein